MARVAREGDVSATVGAAMYPPATAGTWEAGQVGYATYPKLRAGGAAAASRAQATFTFNGTDSGGSAVTGSETVVLSREATKLQHGESGVLLDGDSATGTYGNRLDASSAAKLSTT